MSDIKRIETIDEYNRIFGFKTLHPLLNVVDFREAKHWQNSSATYGFYMIMLKTLNCGNIRYGRTSYDYTDGSIVCIAPNQVVSIELAEGVQPTAIGLLFHPDLVRGSQLAKYLRTKYSFFSYQANEALHVNEDEKQLFLDSLAKIRQELNHDIDPHSKSLLCMHVELLLEYILRFYDRQFLIRDNLNHDVLSRFENLLLDYYELGLQHKLGLPSVAYFADKCCLSANYFGDLIKKCTGKTVQEMVSIHLVNIAKDKLQTSDQTVSEIAYDLGFQYPQHFTRFFKKQVGCTPKEYRLSA